MINTVNIDLSNNSCWGTTNAAGAEENSILLCIKLLDTLLAATDIQLEFTKPDGVIITTDLSVNSKQINYEIPLNLYTTKGTLKLRILATNYTSDYIIFNVSADYIETDDICVKYNATTQEFSINKCEQVHLMQVIDNLDSTSTIDALSANQGRIINKKFENYLDRNLKVITDLNDKTIPTGFYYATSSTKNAPYASGWFVQIYKRDEKNITQILYRYRDNIVFIRQYNTVNSEGWKDWETLIKKSELYYKNNDTLSIKNLACLGHLTSSKTQIIFNIITEKRLDNISTITINSMTVNVRHSDGGYILNGIDLTEGDVSATKSTNNTIRVVYKTESNFTNNCPLSVDIASAEIKFNE